MQYKLPKRRFLPILILSALFAAALSFYILAKIGAKGAIFLPYVATILLAAAFYVFGRFLVFGTVYTLGDDYADFRLVIHRVYQKTSTPIATIEFIGKEELILLDKAGKKAIKKQKKRGVYTANVIPRDLYALVCTVDDVEGYILLELDAAAKTAIEDRIHRARRILSANSERP